MGLADHVMSRVVEPAVLGWYGWRGDPVARWMRPGAKADPYPLYAGIRERGLVRSTVIRKGTPVIVAIGGANRDPAVFSDPDRLQIGRPDASRHLSFSLGAHHCLGAALARLEGRVAVEELTRRYPGLALAGTPARRPLLVLRGYEAIPVRAKSLVTAQNLPTR